MSESFQSSPVAADSLGIANATGDALFLSVFESTGSEKLVSQFVDRLIASETSDHGSGASSLESTAQDELIRVGSAALNAFLQANVTGPVLEGTAKYESLFASAYEKLPADVRPRIKEGQTSLDVLRRICLRSLDIDGVSPYSYVPYIELFCLARWTFTSGDVLPLDQEGNDEYLRGELAWMRFRIHLWHYKLLSQPSLGAGSLFTKAGRWTDVATLQELVETALTAAEKAVLRPDQGDNSAKIQFLLEKANAHILLGDDTKAKHALRQATDLSGFVYALSGALGKRTRFQEKSTSQLIVLAKSSESQKGSTKSANEVDESAPQTLPLNDDTLLEKISFSADHAEDKSQSELPAALRDLSPENQPRLNAEDQIILLTEATLTDTFSPTDGLTSEEILPYAVRVIEDKSTNWQIYTQALLVRSRIELNRSRTVERGVLQMQAVVDQVIVNTTAPGASKDTSDVGDEQLSIPTIQVEGAGDPSQNKPRSFLPAPKASESASPQTRLRYVNALSTPPRWHLESELAYAWASVGSLVSALDIFKRLRLWAEVALCLASSGANEDEGGRGKGGEEKAKAILRWRLFHRTGQSASVEEESEDDKAEVDTDDLKAADFHGPERDPPPPNAPRLFCILGDLENDPHYYQRAWEISKRRFARAQRSLGELYLQKRDWPKALEAYRLAVGVNRLSTELWSRLGDIELRLGHFADAAEAFQRAISTSNGEVGGEDAKTWSNLGTALISWYREVMQEAKLLREKVKTSEDEDESKQEVTPELEARMPATQRAAELGKRAPQLLQDALSAFKRGATIANTNWRIWENVITLAASLTPQPALDDVILGTRNLLSIRKSEDALDVEILQSLLREATKESAPRTEGDGVYDPPRGSLPQKVMALFQNEIIPLITTKSEIWALISRAQAWRRDWAGALDAAEKGWRAATGGSAGSSLLASTNSPIKDWHTDKEAWGVVVERTSELVVAYENWGSRVETIGEKWRGKARMAVRSVMGKAKENWEGSEGWTTLESLMEDLKIR